jgi:hypothetical protein
MVDFPVLKGPLHTAIGTDAVATLINPEAMLAELTAELLYEILVDGDKSEVSILDGYDTRHVVK